MVRLPDADDSVPWPADDRLARGVPVRSKERPFDVLVVDDDPDLRELLVEYFRERGYGVAAAADGRAALAELSRSPSRYGLVITDLQLPGVDGLGVLQAVREANPSAYVIIITGYASLDSAIQAVRLGAYDYLTKPFSVGQIEVILERLTDRQTLEAENRQLARQVGDRPLGDLGQQLVARLDTIDLRLARLENLLRDRLPTRDDRGNLPK
jgi:DNA-binding NtrC family response regulator